MSRKYIGSYSLEGTKQYVEDIGYIFYDMEYREYGKDKRKYMCVEVSCGKHESYWVILNQFKRGSRCRKCGNDKIRKTNEQFIQEVYDLVNDEYTFLEKYINDNTKIKCRHNECGYEWDTTPSSFLQGRRCPNCKGKRISESKTKSHNQFENEFHELVGNEYVLLDKYQSSRRKIKVRHNICGHEWSVTPNHIFNGTRCPQCNKPDYSNNQWLFKEKVYKLVGDEYIFLEDFYRSDVEILCKHNKCGHKWLVRPNNFLNGTRCPGCFGTKKKTTEEFKEEIYHLLNDEYSVIGEYTNNNTKIKIMHNECGSVWNVLPTNILRGQRCPKCIESKGEGTVREYLQVNGVNFQQEYSFDDLKGLGGNPLRFDFAVLDSHKGLTLLIEYDGEFHYKDIFEDGALELQQIHDERKNQYCKDNDIPLLRIPYWEFDNIEQILEEWLDKYKLLHKDKAKEIA